MVLVAVWLDDTEARYRALARQIATGPETQRRIRELISDLERKLREIDE